MFPHLIFNSVLINTHLHTLQQAKRALQLALKALPQHTLTNGVDYYFQVFSFHQNRYPQSQLPLAHHHFLNQLVQ